MAKERERDDDDDDDDREIDERERVGEKEMIDIYRETKKCIDAERYSYTSYWLHLSGEP